MKLNPDGSMIGTTFTEQDTGKKMHVPGLSLSETYAGYTARVDAAVKKGFHLGDLSFSEWQTYCIGGGQTGEDVDIHLPIRRQDPEREAMRRAERERVDAEKKAQEEYEEQCRQRDADWEEENGRY